jgi:uncharacterized protein
MIVLALGGAVSGLVVGYVLQRGQLCFHSAFRGLLERRTAVFKAWALGAAIAAVGLALLDAAGPWAMSDSLPLRPVANVVGGVVFGVGMAVAASCVSGLFYKLGAGMAGAVVGLVGWGLGELAAGLVDLGGTRVLAGRETLPTLLGWPRLLVAGAAAVVVVIALARSRGDRVPHAWQWRWPVAGIALGLATTWTWVAAGATGAGFGASTSGAVASLAAGTPAWWRIAFLAALIPGAAVAARTAGGWWLRPETGVRYAQLAAGGALMGAGARWAGGCNLGHALSGVAQLNLSSFLVVAAMIIGVAAGRAVQVRLGVRGVRQDPAYVALTDQERQGRG